jgi:hypothetical protein
MLSYSASSVNMFLLFMGGGLVPGASELVMNGGFENPPYVNYLIFVGMPATMR